MFSDKMAKLDPVSDKGGTAMNTAQFMRGMSIGIAVGTAIGVACTPKKRHPVKKKVQHAMKLVAGCVDDLTHAMNL